MRRIVGLIAVALLIAACGSSGGARPHAVDTLPPAPSSGTTAPAPQTAEALDFTLPGVTGPQVRGADYAGKSLALWFWAPW